MRCFFEYLAQLFVFVLFFSLFFFFFFFLLLFTFCENKSSFQAFILLSLLVASVLAESIQCPGGIGDVDHFSHPSLGLLHSTACSFVDDSVQCPPRGVGAFETFSPQAYRLIQSRVRLAAKGRSGSGCCFSSTIAYCATTAVAPVPGARVPQSARAAAEAKARYGKNKRYSRERFNVNGQKFLQVRENSSGRFAKPSGRRGRNEYRNVNRAEVRSPVLFLLFCFFSFVD